jgi:hypothetical protein
MIQTYKTAVIAPAIKTQHWQQVYKNFCKSRVPFHFVFVGHVRPDFPLPENFTYIYCNYNAAECTEIAYRFAYNNILDAEYIINIADDIDTPEFFLDKLIAFYQQKVKESNNEFVFVSPMLLGHLNQENLMSLYNGGPVLLGPTLTTIENSKKVGGLDRRFKAIYWDCDRHLRAHQMGAEVLFATQEEVPPVKEIEYFPNAGLWNKYHRVDKVFLDELWIAEDHPEGGELYCSHMHATESGEKNILYKKNIKLVRNDDVIEYDDYYLRKYYE